MTLTKDDLSKSISNNGHLSKARSFEILKTMLEIMKKTLESGDDVLISGFGKFWVKEKNKRQGRNPKTGARLTLDARRVVLFRWSSLLKEKLKGNGV